VKVDVDALDVRQRLGHLQLVERDGPHKADGADLVAPVGESKD